MFRPFFNLCPAGTAGLGLSLGGSASANTIPTADFPQSHNIPPDQRFVLVVCQFNF
jgi:hypothetical protein